MSDSTKQSERIAIAMNDDRQAGRKEIGGGGEWTALRELKAKWLELADSAECYAEEAKRHSYPPEKIESHARTARTLKKCAADLEALAAAAPAPPVRLPKFLSVHEDEREAYEKETAALGPPRGGSSSDLAEQATELRKLPEMWLEVRRKIMDGKGAAKPDAEDLSYADAMKHCAIELNRELRKYDF